MKLKFVISAVSALSLSAASYAADSTVSAGADNTNAPASTIALSPSITGGAHSVASGQMQGGKTQTSVGPYIAPAFGFKYTTKNLQLTAGYELEVGTYRGFNGATKAMSDNAYYQHNPAIQLTVSPEGSFKYNALIDTKWTFQNAKSAENTSEIFLNPDVEYVINPSTSLSVGYVLHRVSNFDAILAKEPNTATGIKAAVSGSEVGQSPVTTLNAGVVTLKNKIAETSKLTTYVRAGKTNGNAAGTTALSYRFQAQLDTTALPKLTAMLRYRLNVDDVKGGDISYYNRGVVELSYELSKNWAAVLKNQFTAIQATTAGKKAAFENENYIGASYSF